MNIKNVYLISDQKFVPVLEDFLRNVYKVFDSCRKGFKQTNNTTLI